MRQPFDDQADPRAAASPLDATDSRGDCRPRRDGVTSDDPAEDGGVFANRHFVWLWLSQVATQIGGNMVLFGLTVLVTDRTHSTTTNSLLLVSFLAPAVLFGAVAGVFVDRFDRRDALVATSALRGLLLILMVVFNANLVLILLLNILISIGTTFFAPAELAMIPLLVRRDQMTAANGLFTLTLNAAFAVGFTLLGPLLTKLAGPVPLIVLVAVLYFVSAILCRTLPSAPPAVLAPTAAHEAEAAMGAVVGQLREGMRYTRTNRAAFWALVYLGTAASVVGVLGAIGPLFAQQFLHLATEDFVIVVLPMGLGVVLGALLVHAIRDAVPRRRLIESGLIVIGVCLVVIVAAGPISDALRSMAGTQQILDASALVSVVTVVVAVAMVAGVAYAAVAIPAQTELQEAIPEAVRGRIFGILNMLVSASSLLPIIAFGLIRDVIGTGPVLLAMAAGTILVGCVSIMRHGPADVRASVRAALGRVRFEAVGTPETEPDADPPTRPVPSPPGTELKHDRGPGAADRCLATPTARADRGAASVTPAGDPPN
jgi:MFS family permease